MCPQICPRSTPAAQRFERLLARLPSGPTVATPDPPLYKPTPLRQARSLPGMGVIAPVNFGAVVIAIELNGRHATVAKMQVRTVARFNPTVIQRKHRQRVWRRDRSSGDTVTAMQRCLGPRAINPGFFVRRFSSQLITNQLVSPYAFRSH